MRRLEDGFLEEVGLGEIPLELQQRVLKAFRTRHEIALGTEVWQLLDEERRSEVDRLIERKDHRALGMFVRSAVPNMREISYAMFLLLMIELRADAPAIRASGQLPPQYVA